MSRVVLAGTLLILTLAICLQSMAQNAVSGGSISGQVTDASGAIVPGAQVVLTNVSTGTELKTVTTSAGVYRFPVLNVGAYKISIRKEGFKQTEINDVIVNVGQDRAANAVLQVGASSESVTVSATTPLLRTTDSSVSSVVDQELISDLPLSGRRFTDFVLLTPNTNADGDFGLVSVAGQQGGADSGYANGNGSNSFTLDGANATSNYFGDARGRTRVPYIFGEQSIQEFQVANSPYDASYGGAGSGFVNTVTKSGTDTLHGDAFYYNRNSGTGANDAVDKQKGIKKPLNVLQQFGADLGGPFAHHSAWFYFDYEQQRQLEPISVINSGVSAIDETSFQVPPGTALPAPNSLFPVPASFGTVPLPSDPNYPIYLQQVSNALHVLQANVGHRSRRRDDLSFFPKVDWQPTSSDHLSFAYNYNRFNSPGGTFTFNPVSGNGTTALPNNYVRDHHATVHYTHNFSPTLLNDLHVSYLRDEQIGTPSGLIDPTLPGVAFPGLGGFFSISNPTYATSDTKESQWEIGEQFNYVHGRHSFKFGMDFSRTHITDVFPGNFLGSYSFNVFAPGDLANFALGVYSHFTQGAGNPAFPFTVPYYGFYVQDKFQVRKNLTLDLGVREDFQVYPQPAQNPAFSLTGHFPNRYQRVSPRLGFAWQARSKTVVRGGFGMFYEVFNGINYENSVATNGLTTHQLSTFVPYDSALPPNQQTPIFPNILPTSSGFGPSSNNISLVDPSFKTPYILESNLEVQQEILPNTTFTIGTLMTRGVHLISSSAYDLNLIPPTGTTTYTVCPGGFSGSGCVGAAGATYTGPTLDGNLLSEGRLTSAFGQINALISPGTNRYNSLYAQLQRRMSHGLAMMISYTWSKDMQGQGADFNNQFSFRNTHGPALLDQRHRASIAAVYSPDATHLEGQFARALFSHWTLSTVMQFNSGRPYTGLLAPAADTVNNSAANQSTNNTAAGLAGNAPSPTQGYNSFFGPSIDEVDVGLARSFHLTERHVITFQAQAFNLFNHANYYVANGSGVNANQYNTNGPTCGDGASNDQTCFLTPNTGPSGFGQLQSINELNGPRILQFSFAWKF